jgi:B-box zinc finger
MIITIVIVAFVIPTALCHALVCISYPVFRRLASSIVCMYVWPHFNYVCVCVCVLVSLTLSAYRDVVLPFVDGMEKCNVCQTAFFFDYKDDKLAQREGIYRELHAAVRKVIQHDHINHLQSHAGMPSSVTSSDSKHATAGAAADADADSPCNWQYGSGDVSPESVSNVCFGALQPTMDKYALLEDMAHHIVDEPSARHLYENRDDKTGLLAACRRSDRMIDESMNHRDFNATPVLLHCGHTVCRGCAYQCVKAHENAKYDTTFAMVDCPTRCNRQTAFVCDLGVEWLPVDIRRIRLLQEHRKASGKPMCCEHKDRLATVRCTHVSCAEFPLMCEECDKAEHSTRNSSKHVRVAPSEMASSASVSPSSDSLCSTHQQPLTGVCVTDGTPLCDKCVYDHVGHEVKRLHEVCADWDKKLEALQRETLVRAHILSDRAASIQHKFDAIMSDINARFDALDRRSSARRNQLAFEARRWRKMQLEESKMLAAESSQLSATAMYDRMLLKRVLDADATDSKSSKPSSSSSSSATVPDAVLGSVARQAQSAGSAIESQCVELSNGIAGMNPQDMNVTFDNASHSSLLGTIQSMGTITLHQAHINI